MTNIDQSFREVVPINPQEFMWRVVAATPEFMREVDGIVNVDMLLSVDTVGLVTSAKVVKCDTVAGKPIAPNQPEIVQAAEEVARTLRFKPAMNAGRLVCREGLELSFGFTTAALSLEVNIRPARAGMSSRVALGLARLVALGLALPGGAQVVRISYADPQLRDSCASCGSRNPSRRSRAVNRCHAVSTRSCLAAAHAHDLFEVNTFWELDADRLTAAKAQAGSGQVTLRVKARKVLTVASCAPSSPSGAPQI